MEALLLKKEEVRQKAFEPFYRRSGSGDVHYKIISPVRAISVYHDREYPQVSYYPIYTSTWVEKFTLSTTKDDFDRHFAETVDRLKTTEYGSGN